MSAKNPAPQRKLLGRYSTAASRELVYETPEGIEIESRDQYDVARKRVLYEDVLLVTYHRELGVFFLILTGLVTAFFFFMGAVVARAGGTEAAVAGAIFAVIGLPTFLAFVIRLLFRVDVITIFGRRSKAAVRFVFRKQHARQLYGSICAKVRQVHRQMEQQYAAASSEPTPAQPMEEPPPMPPTFVAE